MVNLPVISKYEDYNHVMSTIFKKKKTLFKLVFFNFSPYILFGGIFSLTFENTEFDFFFYSCNLYLFTGQVRKVHVIQQILIKVIDEDVS